MATLFTVEGRLSLNTGDFERQINSAEAEGRGLAKSISGWGQAISVAVGNLISNGITKLIGGAKNAVTSAINVTKDFDTSMSQVAATMGKSIDQVKDLRDFAREMGSATAFSAKEAADALNYMALAGYDSATSMKVLPTVLNLAAAGGIGLAQASDMVTDAQSALGLSVEQAVTLVDQMALASSRTNTSVAQLGEAILVIGGTAQNIKGGTQELSTVLGLMADNGIKGAEGGTHLRNMLLSLMAPTDDASKALQKLGVNVFDSEGNLRELKNVFGELNGAMSEMTQAEKAELISTIFNKADIAAVNALLGTNYERWEEVEQAIGDAAGAAQQMANTQLDNLNGDLTIMGSALDEARIVIGEKLMPTLRTGVKIATTFVNAFIDGFKKGGLAGAVEFLRVKFVALFNYVKNGFKNSDNAALRAIGDAMQFVQDAISWIIDNQNIVIAAISGIVAAFAAAKIIEFASGVTSAIGALGGIKGAIGAVVGAMNPWVLAIGAVAAAATLVITNWESVKAWFISAGDTIKGVWNGIVDLFKVKDIFTGEMKFAIPTAYQIRAKITDWWNNDVWPAIQNFFKATFGIELPDWNTVVKNISDWWVNNIWQPIKDFFKATFGIELPDSLPIIDLIADWWHGLEYLVNRFLNVIFGVIPPENIPAIIQDWWETGVWPAIQKFFKATFNIDIPPFDEVVEAVHKWWTDEVWAGLQSFMKTTFGIDIPDWDNILPSISSWWTNTAVPALDAACTWVLQLFGVPVEDIDKVKTTVSGWWEGVKKGAQDACEWFLGIFQNPQEKLADVQKQVEIWWTDVKKGATDACEWFLGIFNKPVEDQDAVQKKVGEWWTGVKQGASDACNWFLKLFSKPTEAASDVQILVARWWKNTKAGATAALNWALKLFTQPKEAGTDVARVVSRWWQGVKDSATKVTTWALKLFVAPNAPDEVIEKVIHDFWDGTKRNVRSVVEGVCDWWLKLFNPPNDSDESITKTVSTWFNGVKQSVVGACAWALQLFSDPYEDGKKIHDTVFEWWDTKARPQVVKACKWALKLFEWPAEKATEITNKVQNWWKNTGEPAVANAIFWVLKLFAYPVETGEQIFGFIKKWWDGIVGKVVEACSWILPIGDHPKTGDKDDKDSQVGSIVGWWETVKTVLNSLLNFTLGLFGLPRYEEMRDKISNWWDKEVVPTLGSLLTFVLSLFELPDFRLMRKKIENWWQDVIRDLTLSFNAFVNLFTGGEVQQSTNPGANKSTSQTSGGVFKGGANNYVTRKESMNAKGLDYVPYTGYISRLEKGEAILPVNEAREWRDAGGRSQDYAATQSALVEAVRSLEDALKNIVLVADGQAIGRIAAAHGGQDISNAIAVIDRNTRAGYGY